MFFLTCGIYLKKVTFLVVKENNANMLKLEKNVSTKL